MLFGDPARKADMVGMQMGTDDPADPLILERADIKRLPTRRNKASGRYRYPRLPRRPKSSSSQLLIWPSEPGIGMRAQLIPLAMRIVSPVAGAASPHG